MEARKEKHLRRSHGIPRGYICPGAETLSFYYAKSGPAGNESNTVFRWKPGSPESGMSLDFRLKPNLVIFNSIKPIGDRIMGEPARRARVVYR